MNLKLIRIIDYYTGTILIQFLRILRFIKHKNKLENNFEPKKILLTKFFGFGNLIFSSPVFYNIRKHFPNAEIHYLTLNDNKGILECYKGYISKPIYLDIKDLRLLPIATFRLLRNLRKEKYDILIDLDSFIRYSAITAFLTNAKITVGYKTKGAKRHYLYDSTVKYYGNRHVVKDFLDLISPLNIRPKEKIKIVQLETGKNGKKRIENWIKDNHLKNKKIIGIHIGASENAPQRKWPYFKELIENLLKETDVHIVLTAGPKEYNECEKIIKNIEHDNNVKKERIKISKDIKLNELPSLIKKFKIYISNDTGPLHMAAAQDIYVIGFYGPNTPKVYGPHTEKKQIFYKPPPCSPCITNFNNKESKCKNPICMKSISINEVWSWLNSNFNKKN